MSHPTISVQVRPLPQAPRGAVWIGTLAATLWIAGRDVVQSIVGAPAARQAHHSTQRRHA